MSRRIKMALSLAAVLLFFIAAASTGVQAAPSPAPVTTAQPEPTPIVVVVQITPAPTPAPTPNPNQTSLDQITADANTLLGGNLANTMFRLVDTPSVVVAPLTRFFLPLGYAVLFIAWAVSLGKRAISMDLMDGKGFLREFGMLIVGMIVITMTTQFCRLIDIIAEQIATTSGLSIALESISLRYSEGFLANLLAPQQMPMILSLILILILYFKIGFRRFILAFYQGIAPLFGAFASSENTQRYVRNFIVQYCLMSFSLVVISVALSLYNLLQVKALGGGGWTNSIFHAAYIIAVIGIVATADKRLEKMFM